jgi:hypothetical protein
MVGHDAGPFLFGIDAAPPWLGDADRLLGADPDHGLVKVGQAGRDQVSASRDFEVLDIQCLADEPT